MTDAKPLPVPASKVLPIPYTTYGTTPTQYQLSKDGSIYTTSIGDMGKTQPWRGRVWRIPADGSKAQMVFEVPGTCQLFVVNKQLLCVWINSASKISVTQIDGYIPLPDAVSGDIVNINENQVALINQRIEQSMNIGATANTQATNALNKVNNQAKTIADLQKRIGELEQKILTKQQVEDIVWSKIWDINYLIRMGFLQGSSAIQQVQDYLNDLTVFIKRIVGK